MTVQIRIDNLPPDKSWGQVKHLVGSIIHHSWVLSVKLLPPMTSMLPPFQMIRSCVVILKGNVDQMNLNKLMVGLNSYQWDYYDLYAYVIPYPMDMQEPPFISLPNSNSASNSGGSSLSPVAPSLDYSKDEFNALQQQQQQQQGFFTGGGFYGAMSPQQQMAMGTVSPMSGIMSPPPSTIPQVGAAPPAIPPNMQFEYMTPNRIVYHERRHPHHNTGSGMFMNNGGNNGYNNYNNNSGSNNIGGGGVPQMRNYNHTQSHNQYYKYNKHSGNSNNFSLRGDGKRDNKLPLLNRDRPTDLNMVSKDLLKDNNEEESSSNNSQLKQIFNEISFRRQMTNRGMWQLKLENFPPFIQLDTLEKIDDDAEVDLSIEENRVEKYGRLRWSILKDFIKLKCPKLLSLCESNIVDTGNGVLVSNVNNTREFYVGVYEDHEEKMTIEVVEPHSNVQYIGNLHIEQGKYKVKAIRYSAVVGFHDKEISDLCLKALQSQEYVLGYKLIASELPPYEEGDRLP